MWKVQIAFGRFVDIIDFMSSVFQSLEKHLYSVKAPSQYIGGEYNSIRKDHSKARVKFLMAFPDAYTIGMSHLGMQIIYGMLNDMEDVLCERAFALWPDLEEKMREERIPLFSIDTHTPAKEFDMIGFSLQTELGYTNILNMLDLAGIPLLAKDRSEKDPIILGGGPCSSYPEPVADFFDIFIIGDGEESVADLVKVYRELKGRKRQIILEEIQKKVAGAYVPSVYDFSRPIQKAVIPSFEEAYYPMSPVVPYSEVVFDRINLEIMRGCPHRCRFCHAVSFKNKLRFKSVQKLLDIAETVYQNTGLDELSLISLSSGDHPHIKELMTRLNVRFKPRHVSVALPSLRIDEKLKELPPLMKTGHARGFTLAPEGGTETFRKLIRKPILDVDLYDTVTAAFTSGFDHIKLYFMIGLPNETEKDIRGIIDTAQKCARIGREIRRKPTLINITISPFVPKPFTAFQFVKFQEFDYFDKITQSLERFARGTTLNLRIHKPRSSYIEAVLSRSGRDCSEALVAAHKLGMKFDEWDEYFNFDKWMEAFKIAQFDPDSAARREFTIDDKLPWDHIDIGTSKKYLWDECQTMLNMAKEREGKSVSYAS